MRQNAGIESLYREDVMRLPIILTVLLATFSGIVAHSQEPQPTIERIEVWVQDLGAQRYTRRDAATRSLIEAGGAAIKPLMKGISLHGLEVTTRGIFVLQQLAVAGDEATEKSARESLEKIAAARVTAAARHARDALEKLDALRQQRALTELQRLGARVTRRHQELSSALGELLTVEIGKDWRGTVDDLRWLAFLQDVEQVTFIGPKVEDDWIAHIAGMPSIRLVKIKRANITAAGLAPLKTLERLEFIRLWYMDIGDDVVAPLAQCLRVTRIELYGTKMTHDGETKLSEALAARIDRRRGAFLGIEPTTADQAAWEIRNVTTGSSADKAGLLPGDGFVTYDTKKVGDFRSLTAMIAEHDVGRIVDITLRRNGEIIERRIKLGEWE
jgi:PDZ domain